MAIVPQTRKRKIELVNSYMKGKLQQANALLHKEADTSGQYDATWQGTVQQQVYDIEADIIKALRWLADNEAFPVPAAFTDQEAKDNINPEIIEYEDGL